MPKSAAAITKTMRPGPGRPTREQAQMRNLELLERALVLFAKKGFERTTMEGIAESVGMAKRTVYGLYGDKKSLFKASLQLAIDNWILPVEELQQAESADLEQTLQDIGQRLVDNIMTPEGLRLLRITNSESNAMPEISAYTYEQGTKQTLEYLSDLFRRRIDADMPNADDAALAFLSLVVGGVANMSAWGVSIEPSQITRHTEYCIRMFLHGLLSEQLRS